jgi:hypothetical protein
MGGAVTAEDEATAICLLEEALHLRRDGERAPGGNENWPDWERKTERFLLEQRIERRRRFRASLRDGTIAP